MYGTYSSPLPGALFVEMRISLESALDSDVVSADVFSVQGSTHHHESYFFAPLTKSDDGLSGEITRAKNVGKTRYSPPEQTTLKLTFSGDGSFPDSCVLSAFSPSGTQLFTTVLNFKSESLRAIELLHTCEQRVASTLVELDQAKVKDARQRKQTVELISKASDVAISLSPISQVGNTESTWSSEELVAALQIHKPELVSPWAAWLFEAKSYDSPEVKGILLSDDSYPNFRKGFALFHDHFLGSTIERARDRLWTLFHELGHCLNLPHTTEWAWPVMKGGMCFMNQYVSDAYWDAFSFQYNPDSLLRIHHGAFDEVCPGQSPFVGSVPKAEDIRQPASDRTALRLSIRPDSLSCLGEPVLLRMNLTGGDNFTDLAPALHPDYGRSNIYVQDSRGMVRTHRPLVRLMADYAKVSLQRQQEAFVWLHSNATDLLFPEPGTYRITATLRLQDGSLIVSNQAFCVIEWPEAQEHRTLSSYLLDTKIGSLFQLGAGNCPAFKSQLTALEEISARDLPGSLSTKASIMLARTARKEFKELHKCGSISLNKAKPDEALEIIGKTKRNEISPNVRSAIKHEEEMARACLEARNDRAAEPTNKEK